MLTLLRPAADTVQGPAVPVSHSRHTRPFRIPASARAAGCSRSWPGSSSAASTWPRAGWASRARLEESIAYSQVRKTFGKPICEHQSIQIKLAEMATRLEASRLLTEQAARAYERGERCDLEAGMAKLFATETALFNSLEAMRLHGAYGYSKEFNIECYYRDAPLLAIGEGTNELQRLIIARQLIERHPA